MNFHQLLIADVLIGFMIMEAVVRPLAVRAAKHFMLWADSHVEFIPDWLYHPLKRED